LVYLQNQILNFNSKTEQSWVSMLTSLTIQNYALIQELNIGLSMVYPILPGETGAGKSILAWSIVHFLVGQRADTSVLLDHSRKCIVEGTFL